MRRILALCVLALALPALVHAASNPVVAAVKKTTRAESSTFRLDVTTTVAGQKVRMTGTGAQRGADAKLSIRTSAQGVDLRFDAVLVREDGSYVMYMRSPAFQAQLPAGKSWLRLDLGKEANKLGIDFTSLVSSSQTFAPLEAGIVSTRRVGRQTVAGRSTTHYRAVVDVKKAARAVPSYGKQVTAIERATGVRLGRANYDVWVGGDGRIGRLRFGMPTSLGGVRGRSVSTITYLSFDQPVSIAAPPRAQVARP